MDLLSRSAFFGAAASTGTGTYDPTVSLILHFDGTNNSTTFTDSSRNNYFITPAGSTIISTTQSKFGGASGYFDGTGDYLYFSNVGSPLDLVTSIFTVETWIYASQFKAGGTRIFSLGGGNVAWNSTNGIHLLIQLSATGNLNLALSNNTGTPISIVSTAALSLNTWTHVAACVNGSTAYLGVNGTVETFTGLTTIARPTTTPQMTIATISGENGNVSNAFQGYLDDLVVRKGIAAYTANYTPPTSAFPNPPAISYVDLLMHFDGTNGSTTFTDSSLNATTFTPYDNVQITTSQSKFGGASGSFDGTGDYLTAPASALWNLNSGQFTLEFFYYKTINKNAVLVSQGDSTWRVLLQSNGTLIWQLAGSGIAIQYPFNLPQNQWIHVAVVRNGSVTTLYIDGTSTGTTTSNPASVSNQLLYIGYSPSVPAYAHQGYIDELRLSRQAVYTGNFTPPTAAFPNP